MKSCGLKAALACLLVVYTLTGTAQTKFDREDAGKELTTSCDRVFGDVWGKACNELHSLMVVRNGKVVYERWANGHTPNELHILWSASKTFTATAVGFAVQDGLLSLDDKVVRFFKSEELPTEQTEWLKNMTIRNLLTMSSGFEKDYIGRANSNEKYDWAKETLASKILFQPGSMFAYNSMNTYLLSVIVSRVTGRKVADYLNLKLFKPLGIKHYIWEESPQGYNSGGWGLYLSTESMAKAGVFFLNRGTWHGKRLLNEQWFDKATSTQILQYQNRVTDKSEIDRLTREDDWNQGYGFQMWRCRHNGFRFDGAWGQFVIILPDKQTVIAITSHTGDTHLLLDAVWKNIYPIL